MAATMQETFQKLAARYRGKANQLFVIGMVMLLVARVGLFLYEQSMGAPERVEAQNVELAHTISADSPIIHSVNNLVKPLPEFADSPYLPIGKFNMFDPKQMQTRAELERKANEKYTEALNFYSQGKVDDAKRSVDDALALQPSHGKAKELRAKIMAALGITTGAASTTATTPAAPGATPVAPASPSPQGPAPAQ